MCINDISLSCSWNEKCFKICREDQNTNFKFNNFFVRKSCRLSDNVGKYDRARQAIDDNKIRWMHFACWVNKGECTPRELETATLLQLQRISARPSWTRGTGLCCAHRKLQRHSEKTKQLRSKETELADISKSCCIARWLSSSCVWLLCVCVCVCVFVPLARKVDEYTNFVFVQLTDHQPGLQHNCHPKGQSELGMGENFKWHEGTWYFLTKTYKKIAIESRLIKARK